MVSKLVFSPDPQPQHLVCGHILNLWEKSRLCPVKYPRKAGLTEQKKGPTLTAEAPCFWTGSAWQGTRGLNGSDYEFNTCRILPAKVFKFQSSWSSSICRAKSVMKRSSRSNRLELRFFHPFVIFYNSPFFFILFGPLIFIFWRLFLGKSSAFTARTYLVSLCPGKGLAVSQLKTTQ